MEVHVEERMTTLGKSILVPSVKEIAKECLEKVADRYIQINTDANQEDYGLNDSDINVNEDIKVPIIDMEALIAGDGLELDKLHSACQDWGFFQVVSVLRILLHIYFIDIIIFLYLINDPRISLIHIFIYLFFLFAQDFLLIIKFMLVVGVIIVI